MKIYAKRKKTIARVFADAKEKHAMRYTQCRGLTQLTNWVKIKFAAMNLKKLATWKWREPLSSFLLYCLNRNYARNPVYAAAQTGFFGRLKRTSRHNREALFFFRCGADLRRGRIEGGR